MKTAEMTDEQYRRALDKLGINQVEAAKLLGVDDRTSRRWALGERGVPGPVAHFLRFLLRQKMTGAEAVAVLGVKA